MLKFTFSNKHFQICKYTIIFAMYAVDHAPHGKCKKVFQKIEKS